MVEGKTVTVLSAVYEQRLTVLLYESRTVLPTHGTGLKLPLAVTGKAQVPASGEAVKFTFPPAVPQMVFGPEIVTGLVETPVGSTVM